MEAHHHATQTYTTVQIASPLTSERIKALAARAIEGAPALTNGEMRELAEAILDHQARSGCVSAADGRPHPGGA